MREFFFPRSIVWRSEHRAATTDNKSDDADVKATRYLTLHTLDGVGALRQQH